MRFLCTLSLGAAAGALVVLIVAPPPVLDETPPPSLLALARAEEEAAQLRRANATLARRVRLAEFHAALWRRVAERAGTPESWGGPVVGTVRPAGREEPELIPPPAVPYPTRPE